MENANNLWLEIKEILKSKLDEKTFNGAFKNVDAVYKEQNGYIYLPVDTVLEKFRIEKFYLKEMNELLASRVTETKCFKIMTRDEITKEQENASKNPFVTAELPEKFKSRTLRPEYTFENFVTGEANREAWTFSIKVADSPHVTVNPLYIFGDVGLGKTHLMTAIGHYVLDNNINANIIYTTAQQYTEDYFNATSRNSRNENALDEFNRFYRSADVLLVDDIQFLKDKLKTQEEFFKLFEYLHENNKQIVITSDRPASELSIMDRLKSRFSWGIPVDIRKPNFELRKAILKKKLAFLINDPNSVPTEVLEFIASNFDENVRELEGALRRFTSYCISFNVDFTLETAEESLKSIISKDKIQQDDLNSNQVESVKTIVSSYFNINPKELSSSSRKQDLVYARMVTIYLLRTILNLPLKKIGEYLGGRDHATVAHAVDKITKSINEEPLIKQDIEYLTKQITKK